MSWSFQEHRTFAKKFFCRIDPDQFFDCNHDRDDIFQLKSAERKKSEFDWEKLIIYKAR